VKEFLPVAAAGIVCACATVTSVSGQTTATPSIQTVAFTEEQAIRGQTLYLSHCSRCHGEALSGQDQAPPLMGPQFSSVWDGEPLAALVARIGTMPPDKPGSLSQSENVDILTYILWYNGTPIGEVPLSEEQSILSDMKFQAAPPAGQ